MVEVTSQMNTRIRLVRCPRCLKVLPELPEIPVYQCGGCGAVLQAKNRKKDTKQAELNSHETNSSKNYEDQCVSDSSNQESTLPVLESSPGSDYKGDEYENGNQESSPGSDYKGDEYGIENQNEQPGDKNFSDELPSSSELSGDGTEKLSIEAINILEEGEKKCPLSEDAGKHGNKTLNHYSELSGNRISSGELPDSGEFSYCKNEDSSLEIEKPMKQDKGRDSLKQRLRKYVKECEETLTRDSELPGNGISSDELLNSGEISYCKNEDSSPEIGEPMKQDDGRDLLEQRIRKYVKESEDGCIKRTGAREYSDELDSSEDLSYQNTETSSPGASDCIKLNGEKDMSEPYLHGDQKKRVDVKGVKPEGNQSELSPGDGAHTQGDESLYLAGNINGKSQDKSADQIEESSQIIESTMVARNKVETSSTIADVHDDSTIRSKSSDVEGSLTPKKDDLIIAARSPLNEGISSENLSPDDINLEKSQNYERLSSAETFESLPVMTRYSRRAMSKSPTRIYYGGDASESSYDGLEDQVLDQPSHLYKRKSKATEVSSIHRSRRKDGSRVNKIQNSGLETHREETASSSMFAENNKYAITRQDWSHDELPEPSRHDHSVRRRVRLDNDEPLSRKPHISRSSQLFNENGSPSRYMNNVFHSPDTTSYTEPDKIELLRMVYELENKLNRTHISKRMENGRFYSGDQRGEKHTPRLYEDSYTRGTGWSGPPKISRMAFSGEAAYCRHQVDCSCSHCYPRDWQCSRHSPSHSVSCSKCQHTAHPGHTCHRAFPSHALSPQHYTSSEASSWGDQDRKRDDQKHKEHEVKRLYLEKYHAAKRHLRPIAGGAPIIVCHHCSELLQLPMDFLVFKKRFHQLRCNSCNRIQKFSLEKKVHIVPYVPNASAPPPSEVDDAHSRTLAPASHSNHLPPAEPVSCSDDYDPSFSRSYSTEQDPSMLAPKNNTNNGKTSYNDSFQPRGDRKVNSVSTRSRSEYLSSREQFESVGSSSKMSRWGKSTSEIQEVPASGSTLHLLMGYSSPRHVLFASPSDDSEVETRYKNT